MAERSVASRVPGLLDVVRLLRPRQWTKNAFVFVGVLFGHGWRHPEMLLNAVAAFLAFCLAASAVYALNDVADSGSDRAHPVKRDRPVASGAISVSLALLISLVLATAAMTLAFSTNVALLLLISAYLAINVVYAVRLKHVVIMDVYIIAAGFMLRILAGTTGIGLAPSKWLLLCGLMLTLFLGFGKRQAELARLAPGDVGLTRRVLDNYSQALLDKLIVVTAAGTIITYSLYTVDEHTIHLQGTDLLIYTVPLVMYGLFRYLYLLQNRQVGEDTAAEFQDPHLVGSVIAWALLSLVLIA